jgi:hypothetical protein
MDNVVLQLSAISDADNVFGPDLNEWTRGEEQGALIPWCVKS